MDLIETLRSTGAVREFTDVDRADGPAFDTAQEGSP